MGKIINRLKQAGVAFKRELAVYRLVLKDPRTPRAGRWLLWLAVVYAVSPIDIIPDFIPIIGHLDDVIVIPVLVICAWKLIPKNVIDEARKQVNAVGQ